MTNLKQQITTIDKTTGEVIEIRKSYSIKTNADKFYMVFIEHMSVLFGIDTATDRKVLDILCRNAEFNTGKVSITAAKRISLCEELSISSQSFANSMTKLKKLGMIAGKSGEYEVNPKIFWKGTTDERAKILREKGLEINIKFTAE